MTDTTDTESLAATIETALRESLPAWWQTPPRLDWAALAVARQVLGTTTGQAETGRFCGRSDCLASGHRFMLGGTVYTCTGQPTPVTTPWPPVPAERPDHELYVTLRKAGLDPGPAQQVIDTYTRTIRTEQPTPCGPVPDACDAEAGDPCANHEREQAHEEGEHAFCGAKCTTGQPETAPTADRAEVLREAADHAESLRQFERATGARWSAQVSENVGILRVADSLRRLADGAQQSTPAPTDRRRLTPNEHDRAWHAIEGSAGEEGADPGTVLTAVLHALRIDPPTVEDEQAASPSRRATPAPAEETK